MNIEIKRKMEKDWKVTVVLVLIFILLTTTVSLGILSYVMKEQCMRNMSKIHQSCMDTFVKVTDLNTTEVLESYEYCALLANSSDLKGISDTCELCIKATTG